MSSEIVAVLIASGLGLLGTVAGTVLGAYLNKRATLATARELAEIERYKYTQDRIWDFRKESYTAILGHLKQASINADKISEGYHDEQMHPEAYHGSENRHKDSRAVWEAWGECKAVFENNRLTVSNEFVTEFQRLKDALATISEYDLPPDIAFAEAKCFSEAYPKLLKIAQDEIAPTKPKAQTE